MLEHRFRRKKDAANHLLQTQSRSTRFVAGNVGIDIPAATEMSVAMSVAELSQLFASCVASSRLFHGIVGYASNHGGDRRATLFLIHLCHLGFLLKLFLSESNE